MKTLFTREDRQFLRSVGIAVEPALDESRLELARRIAKHRAPLQVPIPPDAVLEFLKQHNLPLNRETYFAVAYLGNPPQELDAEAEAEIPRDLF
jgi:hypothetical protein